MVKCPNVAYTDIKKSIKVAFRFRFTQFIKANGKRKIVVKIDKNPTISNEFLLSESCFAMRYEIAKKNAARSINICPNCISWKPGLNITITPKNENKIASILYPFNFSLKTNKAPTQTKIGVKYPIAVTSAIVITVIE